VSKSSLSYLILFGLFVLLTTGCNFPMAPTLQTSNLAAQTKITEIAMLASAEPSPVIPVVTVFPTLNATLVPSPTLFIPTATAFNEPAGCQRPPDDYTRVIVNGAKLNARTLWMLKYAKTLYNGTIDFSGIAITQGSYNPGGVSASFGTHDAGGAVDIAVISFRTGEVLRNELPDAIHALRVAGFAAWVRETNELYQGSPIHIHAIAIGDVDLSVAASEQLTGHYAYFMGYNGLPKPDNIPVADRHGGPILCRWMLEMGFRDMRQSG
jgi:hypothetical protein